MSINQNVDEFTDDEIKLFNNNLTIGEKYMVFPAYTIPNNYFTYMRKVYIPQDNSYHLYFKF